MKFINSFIFDKKKQLKYISIIGLLFVSFFLGRHSGALKITDASSEGYIADSSILNDGSYLIDDYLIEENIRGKVYRCGNSMIYHPTIKHGSFKRCKSKVYELTVEQARKLGMRHCKCSG